MNKISIVEFEKLRVSGGVVAQAFGLSERRIRQLVEEGIIEREKNGNYDLGKTTRKYIEYIKNSNTEATYKKISEKKLNEQFLHEKAKREMAEIKLASMKGEIHHSKDVKRVLTEMLSNFKTKICSIPTKIATQINKTMTIAEIENLLEKEINNALIELTEYNAEDYYSDEFIKIDEDSEELFIDEEEKKDS